MGLCKAEKKDTSEIPKACSSIVAIDNYAAPHLFVLPSKLKTNDWGVINKCLLLMVTLCVIIEAKFNVMHFVYYMYIKTEAYEDSEKIRIQSGNIKKEEVKNTVVCLY